MTPAELDTILSKTLDDFRISRGERRVLSSLFEELNFDDHQLALIRHQAFELARDQIVSPTAHGVLQWLEELMKVIEASEKKDAPRSPSHSEAWFSPQDECVQAIVSLLKRARKRVDICVFTITDNRISNVIADCHRQNIAVRIIADNEKVDDLGSDIEQLAREGIPVRLDKTPYHMHHKYAVFDNKTVLTGSYNWTRSAAESNEENFIVTSDVDLVREFSSHFNKLWTQFA